MIRSLCLLFVFWGWTALAAAPQVDEVFQGADHCVAYHTNKRLFLIRSVQVVGKNCDITAEVIPEPGNRYHVEVTIPVWSFESGEIERDRDVAKILKADRYKTITYVSASMSLEEWQQRIEQETFALEGQLTILDKPHPVQSQIRLSKTEGQGLSIEGVIPTEFKKMDLEPPKLWGGVGARVSEELNLIFKIQSEKTLGASTLLPKEK
jgi:polyisoprenoid-binding protein YceI